MTPKLKELITDFKLLFCIATVEAAFFGFVAWAQWDAEQAIVDRCAGCMQACAGECVVAGGSVICRGGLK